MRILYRIFGLFLLALTLPQAAVFAQEDPVPYSQAELDQMLAPVALYPDSVLSQLLMASTYPLQVIEAAYWSRQHPGLQGDAAVAAVEDRDWDPSVKAMVAFPWIIDRMEGDLDWTTHLGDAFLRQEEQVLATVQYLREQAYAAGHLESSDNIRVYREPEVIIIEPVHPHVVYVPYYDPWTVYGHWRWPAYPPVYWGPPSGHHFHSAFYWGNGIDFSFGFFYSNFDWHHRHVVVHVHDYPYRHDKHYKHYQPGKPFYRHADFDKHYRKWRHDGKRHHHVKPHHDRHHEQHRDTKSRTHVADRSDDRHYRTTPKAEFVRHHDGNRFRRDIVSRPIMRNHADRFHDERRIKQLPKFQKHNDRAHIRENRDRIFTTHAHRGRFDKERERNHAAIDRIRHDSKVTHQARHRPDTKRPLNSMKTEPRRHHFDNDRPRFQPNRMDKQRHHSALHDRQKSHVGSLHGDGRHRGHGEGRRHSGEHHGFSRERSHSLKANRDTLQAPISSKAFSR